VVFPRLSVVDDSAATLKAHGIEDVKDTIAVLAESIGAEQDGGTFAPIVKAGTHIPVEYTQVITTIEAGQQGIDISLFRGNAQAVAENRLIGRVKIKGILAAGAGTPKIELKLLLKRNGDLVVSARDVVRDKSLSVVKTGR
jgi:molecular chaperone DnaK